MPVPLRLILVCLFACVVLSCGSSRRATDEDVEEAPSVEAESFPELDFSTEETPSSWVEDVLESLTLEEKAAQMVMAKMYGHYISSSSDEYQRLVRLVKDLKVGGVIVFQGDIYEQVVLLNKLQRLAPVPLLVAADYERGIAMRTRRGTFFPEAMAIGATRNPDYAYRIGKAIARETRAVGVHQNFAPVADVNNNPANPVINTRSFGEDPDLVSQMVAAFVKGLNEQGVISTVKHFPGHGDTGVDSHLDLPVLSFSRQRLDSLELRVFRNAVESGAMSVMVAHLEVPAIDPGKGVPATLSSRAINGVLKSELGFEGLVVTDAMDMRGLMRGYSVGAAAVRAVKAGVDILLMPTDERGAVDAVVAAVRRGEITEQRLNESVRKILVAKQWLQLNEESEVDVNRVSSLVGTKEHWRLAREVARSAVTILRNDKGLLPLQQYGKKKLSVIMMSDIEDNRTEVNRPGYQWTNEPFGQYFIQQLRRRYGSVESFRLTPSSNSLHFDAILEKAKRADILLLPLYVKVRSSSGKTGIPDNLVPFVTRLAELKKPVLVIALGNPYVLGAFPGAQGVMCTYSDAEVHVEAAVEAMFGEIDVRGKLPVTIPGLFPFGTGIQFPRTELRMDDPFYAGFSSRKLDRLDSLVQASIRDSAFSAAQLVVIRDGIMAYNKAFGSYTYDAESRSIDESTLFDLASLTKVVATTSAVMKLVDGKRLKLSDRVGDYLQEFSTGNKGKVTIRHLLDHSSGLPPFRKLWGETTDPEQARKLVLEAGLVALPGDTTIYSDLGMVVLGFVVEKISGRSLDSYVRQEFFEPLEMVSTTFRPSQAIWTQTAPTEIDSVWRKAIVQGSVHDENAAVLGGVAGHAGLFSTASDLAIYMQMILNKGTYGGIRFLSDSTVSLFTRRQGTSSTRALGWDTKSPKGSSAGEYFSATSFGHTGFTGTSIWVDPERKLCVIFLTNRVHPTRINTKIVKIRPAVHDLVIQALLGGQER